MSDQTFILLSGLLSFGVPMLIALRELRACRTPRGHGPGGGPSPDPRPAPSGPASDPKKLPDCLIPRPLPPGLVAHLRVRAPELVD